jgi:FAD/FMN-containing dehydrogenase
MGHDDSRHMGSLVKSLDDQVVLPGDPRYDQAIQLADTQFDAVHPRAVVFCEKTSDIKKVLRCAQHQDLPLAVRSGGHSTAGYSMTPGIVLDVSRLNRLKVGPNSVTMGVGTQAVDAAAALAPHGLATPNGFCPTVSAGGFFTGGGFGLLSRSTGMACDRLLSAEIVLADGRVVRTSPKHEPDLFWAIQGGGGGNFGVLTSYEIRPAQVPRAVNFTLVWLWPDAADVVSAWQRWAPTAPEGLTSWLGIFLQDASPGQVAQVAAFGLWRGEQAQLEQQLNALTAEIASPPVVRQVEDLPYQTAMMNWWFCGGLTVDQCHRTGRAGGVLPRTPHQTLRGRFFDSPLPSEGVDRFLAAFDADRRPGQSRISLSAGLAGQVNAVGRTDTAYVHRTSTYHLDFTVTLPSPAPSVEEIAASRTWANAGFHAIDEFSNGESYQNYTDPQLDDWPQAYYAENYPRLLRVKRTYDPHTFFRFDQSIGQEQRSNAVRAGADGESVS